MLTFIHNWPDWPQLTKSPVHWLPHHCLNFNGPWPTQSQLQHGQCTISPKSTTNSLPFYGGPKVQIHRLHDPQFLHSHSSRIRSLYWKIPSLHDSVSLSRPEVAIWRSLEWRITRAGVCHALRALACAMHYARWRVPCITRAGVCHALRALACAMHYARWRVPCITRAGVCHALRALACAMHYARWRVPCITRAGVCHVCF